MWVKRMPAPYAPSWTPGPPRLPLSVRGAPNNMLGAYRYDNTMGAVSGQASGAVGGAAMGAKAGSVFGPIGTGVGAAVGAIAGALLGGHADHAKIARDVAARKQLFSDYLTVAGTIPGRAIGIEKLRDIWKGAAHMGHFPGWGNREQHIDGAVNGWHTTLQNFRAHHPQAPAVMQTPTTPALARAQYQPRFGGRMLQGLGDLLGDVGLDAKTLVDAEWWPGNQWAVGTDAIGMQVVYDSADAYLASIDPSTPPSIGAAYSTAPAPAPAPAPVQAGPVPAIQPSGPVQQATVPVSTLPTQQTSLPTPAAPVVPAQVPASPTTTTIVPVPATSAGTPDISALVRQLMAQGQSAPMAYGSAMSSLQAAGVQPTPDVQQETAQAVQAAAGGSGVPGWAMLLLAGGALFVLARPRARGA